MSNQSRKSRGMRSQLVAARYLNVNGFPYAESTGAGRSGADITGVGDLDFEVKARTGFEPMAAIKQLKERAKEGILGLVLMRLNGQGEESVKDWVILIRFEDAVKLLRGNGHGEKL